MATYTTGRCLAAALASTLIATPARADHAAASTGPGTSGPIVGTAPATLGPGDLAFAMGFSFAEPKHRSDATLAALAGQHIHAHDQDHSETYTLSAAYGVAENLGISLVVPYVRRIAIREGEHSHFGGIATNTVVERGNSAGFGDATLVAKWRFSGENHHGWEAALLAGLKLPTGATRAIDDNGERFETEHQPGTGSWDPVIGLAVSHPVPGGGFYASGVYQISTTGSQDIRLGDRAQGAVGFSQRLIGAAVDHHGPAGNGDGRSGLTLDAVLEFNGEWEGRLRDTGVFEAETGGKALYVSPGFRLNANRWSIAVSGSVPLAQEVRLSHSETTLRMRLEVGWAF